MTLISTGLVNPWSQRNQSRRHRQAAEQGILDLAQGHWKNALRHLRRAAQGEAKPLVYLLGAARAAEQLGLQRRADELLEQALIKQPSAEVAIALAHADLQLQRANDAALKTPYKRCMNCTLSIQKCCYACKPYCDSVKSGRP